MGSSITVRLKNAGSNLAQFITLGLAALALAPDSGEWLTRSAWIFWVVCVAATVYFFLTLRELARSDPRDISVFKFPSDKNSLLNTKKADRALEKIGLSRAKRISRAEARIADYMVMLLSNSSKARILTRDLSWNGVASSELKRLAASNALSIIHCEAKRGSATPSSILQYQTAGAAVKSTPLKSKVRMTITEASGSEVVAIGYREDNRHVISRIRDHHDPVFQLAVTLFDALDGRR